MKWRDVRPSIVIHIQNLCSAFNPSKCIHTLVNTHTHREHTPGAVGSHIAAAPEGAVGGSCLAQGSHLSRGIEGGSERWSFTPPLIPAGPSRYKSESLTIRPWLPLYCLSYCCKWYLHGTPRYFYKYDNITMLHVQNVTWHQLFYNSYNSSTYLLRSCIKSRGG